MMKMTEQTTLADLATYLNALGNPFVTMMKGLDGKRHAIMHLNNPPGMFMGQGETVADALEAMFSAYRRATLPDGLKAVLEQPLRFDGYAEREHQPLPDGDGPQCEAKGQCDDVDGSGSCYGCGRWLGDDIQGREVGKPDRRREHRPSSPRRVSDAVQQRIDARNNTVGPCHGCSHAFTDHPNDSGCQFWHDGSELKR
jgi:hypothetical protein